jgi:hypothetical protein
MAGAGTVPRLLRPIVLDATNNAIRVRSGAVTETLTVPVGTGTYYQVGNPACALDFITAVQTGLNTNTGGAVYTLTLASNGQLTVASTLRVDLLLNDALTTLPPAALGFLAAAYSDAAGPPFSLTSPGQVDYLFNPELEYVKETEDNPSYGVTLGAACEGQPRGQRYRARQYKRTIEMDILPPNKLLQAEEVLANESFERFFEYLSLGRAPFVFVRDITALPATLTAITYVIRDQEWLQEWPATFPSQLIRLATLRIPMRLYVP